MEEQEFLNEKGITVTLSRFVIDADGQMYTINGITSVRQTVVEPPRGGAIAMIVIGALASLISIGLLDRDLEVARLTLVLGVVVGAIGVIWFNSLKSTYAVTVRCASGESRTVTSNDGPWIAKITQALNDAVVARR